MIIERAQSGDSLILTEITKKSKAYWGYSPEQIESWAAQLTVSEEYILAYATYKLILESRIIGYYAFKHKDDSTCFLVEVDQSKLASSKNYFDYFFKLKDAGSFVFEDVYCLRRLKDAV